MHPPQPPLPPKPPQKPLVFGKPEETILWRKILPWAVILLGLGCIALMIANNTTRKPLVCESPVQGSASLTTFGTCTTE